MTGQDVTRPRLISIIIPCFNEQEVLPLLFERLTRACQQWPHDWQVIAVDDGSTDNTWALLRDFHHREPRWKAVSFSRNFGHQVAVSAGLHHAQGDAVIVMDADLQDPPEELHRFIDPWLQGYEVVYAIRQRRKEGLVRRICYALFYRMLAKMVNFTIPLDSGDFCLMDRRVVDILKQMPERNRFVRGMRAWAGFRQVGVPYERQARAAGRPQYTLTKLIKLAVDGLVSFSAFPLKLASHMGFYISALALLGVLFTLVQRIFSEQFAAIGLAPAPGYATMVIAVLFLGGIQLIFLGVMGEYLFRIFEEVKARPTWIERERCGL